MSLITPSKKRKIRNKEALHSAELNEGPKCQKSKSPVSKSQSPSSVAHGEKTTDPAPGVSEPAKVQVTPRAAPRQARDAAVAIRIRPDRTESHDLELLLKVWLSSPQSQELWQSGRTIACLSQFCENFARVHLLIEVEEPDFHFLATFTFDREALLGDISVHPVVMACLDHLGQSLVVIHDHLVGGLDRTGGHHDVSELFPDSKIRENSSHILVIATASQDWIHDGFDELKNPSR